VEEQTILVLVQIVEANETLQPTHDYGKSDGADGAVLVASSRWPGLLVFLVVVLPLGHLLLVVAASQWLGLLVFLIVVVLLLDRLILGHLLP
jgi:hypothetical protein